MIRGLGFSNREGLATQRATKAVSVESIMTSPSLLESRMHSERCLSGSARGRAKPLVARPEWRACPTQRYIPIKRGFLYLVAIMDWQSRKVLSWRLSNTMDTHFCIEALEEALALYGVPEIFNTDQGSQFTSCEFTSVLKEHGINISMDGKGRWMDNVFIERLWRSLKYECVYLNALENGSQARHHIGAWLSPYNQTRPHSTFDGQTPDEVYNLSHLQRPDPEEKRQAA
jgi:putative transposase